MTSLLAGNQQTMTVRVQSDDVTRFHPRNYLFVSPVAVSFCSRWFLFFPVHLFLLRNYRTLYVRLLRIIVSPSSYFYLFCIYFTVYEVRGFSKQSGNRFKPTCMSIAGCEVTMCLVLVVIVILQTRYLKCINFCGVLIFAVNFTAKISTPRKLIHREQSHNSSQYFGFIPKPFSKIKFRLNGFGSKISGVLNLLQKYAEGIKLKSRFVVFP